MGVGYTESSRPAAGNARPVCGLGRRDINQRRRRSKLKNLIKYAELSGILIPAALKEAVDEAGKRLSEVRCKKAD